MVSSVFARGIEFSCVRLGTARASDFPLTRNTNCPSRLTVFVLASVRLESRVSLHVDRIELVGCVHGSGVWRGVWGTRAGTIDWLSPSFVRGRIHLFGCPVGVAGPNGYRSGSGHVP